MDKGVRKPKRYLELPDRVAWRAWLQANHARASEIWLVHVKKGFAAETLGYEDAVEEALCFGWIDGLLNRLDERRYILRYSPRKPNSVWSEGNKRRVNKLIREGRMTEFGLAAVRAAKASGEWRAAAVREQVDEPPAELRHALKAAGRLAAFRCLTATQRKQHIYAVMSAKTESTRAKRVRAVVQSLEESKGEG